VFLYYDVPLVDKYAIHSKHGKNSSTKKKEREKYIVFHHDSSLHKPNMVILPTKQNPGKKSNAKHAKHQIVPLGLAQAIIDSNRKGTELIRQWNGGQCVRKTRSAQPPKKEQKTSFDNLEKLVKSIRASANDAYQKFLDALPGVRRGFYS
jgi:hypothetical protein